MTGEAMAIAAVAFGVFAMRAGGYLAAASVPLPPLAVRVLRLAPGHLFVAFAAAAIAEGGTSIAAGCAAAAGVMLLTRQEAAALAAGAAAVALGHWLS
jgi:hypothetical protein